MDTGIGASLRNARNRRRVDISEAERATKIRARFLWAMENEDWDALPGGAYTRGFIRTYGSYLGLDGPRLAEEYRRASGEPRPGERGAPRADPVVASGPPRHGSRFGWGVGAAIALLLLVAVLAVVGLTNEGGGGSPGTVDSGAERDGSVEVQQNASQVQDSKPGVSVRLAANAEIWVCLLDAEGRELIDGQVLVAGAVEGPFRSDSFTVSFGNGEVSMWIDEQQVSVPESSSPIGYEIGEDGELSPLREVERPTCV